MPDEKTNAVEAEANATAEKAAETTEIDWKAEAERLQREREALESNYKASQRNLNDLQTKLRQAQARGDDITALNAKIQSLEESIAVALDDFEKRGEPEYLPGTKPSVSRLERLKEQRRQAQEQEARLKAEVKDFWDAVKEAGISTEDPELIEEVMKVSETPREALRKLPAFISKRIRKEQEELLKREAEGKKTANVKAMQESGALAIDKTTPVSTFKEFTVAQVKDRAFFEEHKDEILKAYKEGRIKE